MQENGTTLWTITFYAGHMSSTARDNPPIEIIPLRRKYAPVRYAIRRANGLLKSRVPAGQTVVFSITDENSAPEEN